jgi:hypothetical protein
MNLQALVSLADSMPSKKRMAYRDLVAPAATLHAKGYTLREIHTILVEKGIPVNPNPSTFASSMSQHFKRRKAQLLKA